MGRLKGFTRLTFRAPCLRLGNFRTLSLCVVEKSLNWPTFCAALHYGPLETAPLEGFDPPGAAMVLLLTVESVLVCTVFVFSFVPDLENTLLCTSTIFLFFTTQRALIFDRHTTLASRALQHTVQPGRRGAARRGPRENRAEDSALQHTAVRGQFATRQPQHGPNAHPIGQVPNAQPTSQFPICRPANALQSAFGANDQRGGA